jgi:hypothetical protein
LRFLPRTYQFLLIQKNAAERWTAHLPAITLDLARMKAKFAESDEKRRLVVHEQLAAMERYAGPVVGDNYM